MREHLILPDDRRGCVRALDREGARRLVPPALGRDVSRPVLEPKHRGAANGDRR